MLSQKKLQAALLLAQGRLTIDHIAEQVGKSPRTIDEWKQLPEMRREIHRHHEAWAQELKEFGIGDQRRRLRDLQDLYDRLWVVIGRRAQSKAMRRAAGGDTGLVCREVKKFEQVAEQVPGKDGKPETVLKNKAVVKFRVDTALIDELREIQKQAAIELGQWTEKRSLSGKVTFQPFEFSEIEKILAKTCTREQLETLSRELEKVAA